MIQQIVKEWESLLDISENESILDDEHFEKICKTYDKQDKAILVYLFKLLNCLTLIVGGVFH